MAGGVAAARCAELRAAGERLEERPGAEIAAALDTACARWRDPADPDRRAALTELAARYGVPERSVAVVLDAAFGAWREADFRRWIESELGSPDALDGPVELGGVRRLALGPDLVVALSAHGVPTTPVADLIAALIVKAPIWLKPASGADDLAARFAATLASIDPGLGAAVETRAWSSRSPESGEILAAADVVVATGRGETIAELQRRIGERTRLVAHGPRLSAALIAREALERDRDGTIAALADDAAFAGQRGCLSPVVAWIEAPAPEVAALVEPVHAACVERWPSPPRAEAEPAERAGFAEWLALAGVERAAGHAGPVAGGFDDAWSVQARARPGPLEPPPIPRLLVLSPLADAADAVELCARRRGVVATVGLAASPARGAELAARLARAGVERVTALGSMQRPPLAWRRDGRATLADLVRWIDVEV